MDLRWSVTSGDGTPLLLINGLGGNVEMWSPLRAALGPRATIAFDSPGSGLSSTPLAKPSIRLIADAIADSLDQLGIDEADVLGYSFGGVVAQELALRHPGRIRRLVLAATTPGFMAAPFVSPIALSQLLTPARYYVDPALDFLNIAAVGAEEGSATFTKLSRSRRIHPPTLHGYWWQLMAISMWSSRNRLRRLTMPCLIVTGENDRVAGPDVAKVLLKSIPGARMKIAQSAGHLFLYADAPHPILGDIVSFLDHDGALRTVPRGELVST